MIHGALPYLHQQNVKYKLENAEKFNTYIYENKFPPLAASF